LDSTRRVVGNHFSLWTGDGLESPFENPFEEISCSTRIIASEFGMSNHSKDSFQTGSRVTFFLSQLWFLQGCFDFSYYLNKIGSQKILTEALDELPDRKRNVTTPQLAYQAGPIRDSLQLLGRKWTLLIIRDIAFLKLQRFGEILRNNPGLTPRVLSRRLEQMTKEGLVVKKIKGGKSLDEEIYGYYLTSRGEDAVYVLLPILRYGIKHCMNQENKGKKDEKEMIRDLHYDVLRDWS
jgi:DNA-binding HxlR family transcriptional regulator